MGYKNIDIREIMEQIERDEMVIPSIQRKYVWKEGQIIELFDSLLKGYPLGYILFWNVPEKAKKDMKYYKFTKKIVDSKDYKEEEHEPEEGKPLINVLDGQQRLTSLYIGFRSIVEKKVKKNKKVSYLCINLLKEKIIDEEDNEKYNLKFLTDAEIAKEKEKNIYWCKIKDITEAENINGFLGEKGYIIEDIEMHKKAYNAVANIFNVYNGKGSVSIQEERLSDLEKILEIFVRINKGGTKLSQSDLLLSYASSNWKKRDARYEIDELQAEMNSIEKGIGKEQYEFSKDFILQTALMLTGVEDFSFKLKTFNANAQRIESDWDEIRESMLAGVELIRSIGFTAKIIKSSSYPIIPVIYYLHKHRIKLEDIEQNGNHIESQKSVIKEYLIKTYLKKLTTGIPAYQFLKKVKDIIDQSKLEDNDYFPYMEIIENYEVNGRRYEFTEKDIKAIVETKKSDPMAFFVLNLIIENDINHKYVELDHIVPTKKIANKKPKDKEEKERNEEMKRKKDEIANIQLITSKQNKEKGTKDFGVWIRELYGTDKAKISEHMEKMFIDNIGVNEGNFLEFYERRKNKLYEKLSEKLRNKK